MKLAAVSMALWLAGIASAQFSVERLGGDDQGKDRPPPPNPRVPVDYIEWVNERHDKRDEDNAAENYAAAFKLFVDDDGAKDRLARRAGGPWSSADNAAARSWIESNRDCLDQIGLAVQRKHCYFLRDPKAPDLAHVELPHMAALRGVGRVLATRATLRFSEGDAKAGMSDVGALLKIALQLDAQPSIVEALVGIALATEAYDTVRYAALLCGEKLSAREMLDQLRRVDRSAKLPMRNLQFDRVMAMDVLQRYLKDSDGDGAFDAFEFPGAEKIAIKPTSLKDLLDDYDACIGEADKIFASTGELNRKLLKDLDDHAARSEPAVAGLAPGVRGVDSLLRRREAARAGARIALRLQAYRAEHGKWPESLEVAMKGEQLGMRMDPYSGDDMVYKSSDPPVVYSLGPNGVDDAGQRGAPNDPAAADDILLWPIKPPGSG